MRIDISKVAMLVNLNIGWWSGRKFDRKSSDDVTKRANADTDRARVNKLLVAKEVIFPVQQIVTGWRQWHTSQTMPWIRKAHSLLPVENFDAYSAETRAWRSKFENAVVEFKSKYELAKQNAKRELGDLYDPYDYPSAALIGQKFYANVEVMPMPNAKDFRVDIAAEEVEKMQREIERSIEARVTAAMDSLWRRLYDVIAHMHEKLREPEATFRDSLVHNVRELTELLPRLNVTRDKKLASVIKQASERLCPYEPEVLRKQPDDRAEAAKRAEEILKAMSGCFAKEAN